MENAIKLLKQKESEMTQSGSDVAKNLAYSYRKAIALLERCDGKDAQTSEKDLRVCEVNGSALFQSMGEFAYKAFPDATSIEHLKKLKIEADEAIEEPKNIVEYSDCLLALFGAAHKAGFTYDQLLEAGQSKFEIVKTRNWEKLPDGTYQHCH